jgi:hypothetical protein
MRGLGHNDVAFALTRVTLYPLPQRRFVTPVQAIDSHA